MTNLLRTIYEFANGALYRWLLERPTSESGRLYHEDDRGGQTRGQGRGRSRRFRRVLEAFGLRFGLGAHGPPRRPCAPKFTSQENRVMSSRPFILRPADRQ